MVAPVNPSPLPPLPQWNDPPAVASYITSILAIVFAVVALAHPGFTEPAIVQSLVPAVATVVAGVAQAINVWTHRAVQKAAWDAYGYKALSSQ